MPKKSTKTAYSHVMYCEKTIKEVLL